MITYELITVLERKFSNTHRLQQLFKICNFLKSTYNFV